MSPDLRAPAVHYLTRHLRVPCRPDLKDLTGAPLNSRDTGDVTCDGSDEFRLDAPAGETANAAR